MATFSVKIAAARLGVEYTESPALHASSMNVLKSEMTGQFDLNASITPRLDYPFSGKVFSKDWGLPYLAAADLAASSKWLVRYNCSIGSNNSSDMVEIEVTDTPVEGQFRSFSTNAAECNTPNITPEAMNGSHATGFFVLDTIAGRDLGFLIRSTVGVTNPVYYYAMHLEAIPLDGLTEGVDYWYYHATPDNGSGELLLSTSSDQNFAQALQTPSVTFPQTGDYLLEASCTFRLDSLPVLSKGSFSEDFNVLSAPWQKRSGDTRDKHTFNWSGVRQYAQGQTVPAFYIWGANSLFDEGSGAIPRYAILPRIFIWNLQSFEKYAHNKTTSAVYEEITATYPAWQDVVTTTLVPYQTVDGEYVMLVGKVNAYRTTFSSVLARLINKTTQEVLYEFNSMANVAGVDADRISLTCYAVPLVNTTNEYALQVCRQGQGADTGFWGYASIAAVGLTEKTVPTGDVTLDIIDNTNPNGIGESGGEFIGDGGTTQVDLDIFDNSPSPFGASSLSLSGPPPPSGIPVAHPRLWIYGNDRLAYWQSQVGGAFWNTMLAKQASGYSSFKAYPWAIAYVASGDTAHRDSCIARLEAVMASPPVAPSGPFEDRGLITRDWVRDFAICYDLLYDYLTASKPVLKQQLEDFMLAMTYFCYNQDASFTTAVYDNFFSQGVNSPLQNYYNAYLLTATYTALALYHHQPTTVGWPPGSTTNRTQFIVPQTFTTPGSPLFTDVYELVLAKYAQGAPVWGPYMVGGGWHEGANYGKASIRHQLEILLLLRDTAGVDLITNEPYYADTPLYQIYTEQPGSGRMMEMGDEDSVLNDYNRGLMLMAADLLTGSSSGEYAQWWATNVRSVMNGIGMMSSWDFWLYRGDRTATDYRNALAPHYFAEGTGLINSRDAWGANQVSVSFNSMDHIRDHQHKDNNQIQIFNGNISSGADGWVLTDAKAFSTDGKGSSSLLHNTYMVKTANGPTSTGGYWSQRSSATNNLTGLPVGSIDRQVSTAAYTYALGNCNDAYYQTKLSSGSQANGATNEVRINDIFLREFFHLRSLNIVLAYDRFRILPAWDVASTEVRARWHYPRNQPVVVSSNTVRSDVGNSKTFRRFLMPAAQTSTFVDMAPSYDAWAENVMVPLTNRYGNLFTAFQVFTSATPVSMVSTDVIYHGAPASIGGTMDGVTLMDTVRKHILFSAEQDGSTPSSITYAVLKQNDNDQHYVCNLVSGQDYFVFESDIGGGYFRYTLTPSFNTQSANSGGVLEFTPGTLTDPNDVVLNIFDDTPVHSSIEGNYGIGFSELDTSDGTVRLDINDNAREGELNPGLGESVFTAAEDVTEIELTINDDGTPGGMGVSTVSTTDELVISDSTPAFGVSALDIDITEVVAQPIIYVEKRILSLGSDILPSADFGASVVLPEPNDGIFYDKVNNSNDQTFVRFAPPQAFPTQTLFLAISRLDLGITDNNVYRGVIPRWRYQVRVRSADVSGISGPVLVLKLIERSTGTVRVQYNMPFTSGDSPVVLESTTFDYPIHVSEIPELAIRLEARAQSYAGVNYVLELSSVKIVPIGAPLREKNL